MFANFIHCSFNIFSKFLIVLYIVFIITVTLNSLQAMAKGESSVVTSVMTITKK